MPMKINIKFIFINLGDALLSNFKFVAIL